MENDNKIKWILIAICAVVVALLVVIFVSSSKSVRIKKVEKFTAQVEQEYMEYSDSDLEKAKAKFDKLVAKAEKKELAGDEERHLNQLKGECKGYFALAKARILLQNFHDDLDEAGDDVKDAVKNLTDN